MEKYKAIPEGYMTVGQVAKKMGVTVRTLQYYDNEGLISPSSESEGGRRLYTYKDVISLHQILSMKSLGFSLSDIKNRLIPLNTPADIANVLTEQSAVIQAKIESLSSSLKELETLKVEVLQMQRVDFKKYADIIVNLQMKNEFYWLIKHFDDKTLDHIRSRFDMDSGTAMMKNFKRLLDEAVRLQSSGVNPKSEKGREFAKDFWAMIMDFTGGDMSMLPELMKMGTIESAKVLPAETPDVINSFISPSLEAYFDGLGINPIEDK